MRLGLLSRFCTAACLCEAYWRMGGGENGSKFKQFLTDRGSTCNALLVWWRVPLSDIHIMKILCRRVKFKYTGKSHSVSFIRYRYRYRYCIRYFGTWKYRRYYRNTEFQSVFTALLIWVNSNYHSSLPEVILSNWLCGYQIYYSTRLDETYTILPFRHYLLIGKSDK